MFSLICALNKLSSKRSWGWWFETPSCWLWHHYNGFRCELQYIPKNMHTVLALLCFVVVMYWLIYPYPSGLLHWHCGNLTIAPVRAKQPWWIWVNATCEFVMNDYITTTKQSTTKPCINILGYTVHVMGLNVLHVSQVFGVRGPAIFWIINYFYSKFKRSDHLWIDINANLSPYDSATVNLCHWLPDVAYHRIYHDVSNRYTPYLDGQIGQEWIFVGIVDIVEDCALHCSKNMACNGIKLPVDTTDDIFCWIKMWLS